MSELPFAPACERNQQVILEKLQDIFKTQSQVLEIGSGTGQHAVYFARAMPQWRWQPTDLPGALAGIELWRDEAGLSNIVPALALDVDQAEWPWPEQQYQAVFTANTLHIMGWSSVCNAIAGVGRVLADGGVFCAYGPFNYQGKYTSPSNADFDQWLKQRDPQSAIRDFEAVCEQAALAGMTLQSDEPMPANNRLLTFCKNSQ